MIGAPLSSRPGRPRFPAPSLVLAGVRHLARHPWQAGLAVLGIALGVAVVVAIDLANTSARRAFTLSAEAVTGRATDQVTGGPGGLDEQVYVRLLAAGLHPVAPVIEAEVGLEGHPGRALTMLGIDPLADSPFRPFLWPGPGGTAEPDRPAAGTVVSRLLTEPGSVLLAGSTARDLGVAPGGRLILRVSGALRPVTVVGLLSSADGSSSGLLDGLLVADVATAQEALGMIGRLSRIDLRIPDGAGGRGIREQVAALLPPGASLEPAGRRSAFAGEVTRAFSVNLTALSLLALLVGMFLIHSTVTFSVVQRRRTIGRLRALGVTGGEVVGLILVEAALTGLVASGIGLLLGIGLARGLVRLVTRTINDLYFVVAVRELWVSPFLLAKGAALGLGATLAAALLPALEAARTLPGLAGGRVSLEAKVRQATPRAAGAGILTLAAGLVMLGLPTRSLGSGYLSLFAIMGGAALLTPAGVVGLARSARATLGRVVPGRLALPARLAAGGVVASLSRTAVAGAALMVAVAAAVGVGLMVGSFRVTVDRWLADSLVADVYVSAPTLGRGPAGSTLAEATVARLSGLPGVAAAGTYRAVQVTSTLGPIQLVALGLQPTTGRQFRFLAGDPVRAWRDFTTAGSVIVSEPFAYRHRLAVGDRLTVRTDRGLHAFPVAGVFSDYGSDRGVVMISRVAYEALWDDRGVSSVALAAAPGTSAAALTSAVRAAAPGGQALLVRDHRALREASLEIFDRTFAITRVLRLLTLAVAFVGVLSALMALALERERELAVLRAQGLTPLQLWAVVTGETGLLGLAAGVLALPVGVAVALVLVHVINRRAFGWTLTAVIDPAILAEAAATAVVAAVLAGLYPAFRMARTPPALGLREE